MGPWLSSLHLLACSWRAQSGTAEGRPEVLSIVSAQEEKARLLRERLDQIHLANERRCCQAPVYGRDLLRVCSLPDRAHLPGKGAGLANSHVSPSQSQSDLLGTLQDVLGR